MTKNRILILLLTVILGLGVLGFSTHLPNERLSSQTTASLLNKERVNAHAIRQRPEHITYELLFRRISFLKQKGMSSEDRSSLLGRELGLSPNQIMVLEQVAETSLADVNLLDAKAKTIIEKKKAEHSKGKIKPGQLLPPVPQELIVMQEERNNIILGGRRSLQKQLGDKKFRGFDEKVKKEFAVKIPQKSDN